MHNQFESYFSDDFNRSDLEAKFSSIIRDFQENNTSNNNRLYGILLTDDSSTSVPVWTYQMIDRFKEILRNCSTEETEDESSPFIIATKDFLETYGETGFDLIKSYVIYLITSANIHLISDMVEMIGDIRNAVSKRDRYIFLKNALRSPIPEVRYGAVLGLGNIGIKEAYSTLEEVSREEEYPLIQSALREVLSLLRT